MSQLSALSLPEALAAVGAALRARRGLIVICAVLAAGATIVLNVSAPHEARVTVSFDPLQQSRTMADLGIPAPGPPTADQIRSDGVFDRMVRDRLVPPEQTVGSLRDDLRVENFQPGQEATLVAREDTESDAIAVANGWANGLIRVRQDVLLGQFDRVREALLGQLAGLPPGRLDERRAIGAQLSRLDAARQALQPEVTIARGALPVSSSGRRNELLALLLGAAAGALAGLFLEAREARLRTGPAAEAAFGAPVLGTLGTGDDPLRADGLASRVATLLPARDGSNASHLLLVTTTDGVSDQRGAGVRLGRALAGEDHATAVVLWRAAGAGRLVLGPELTDAGLTVVQVEGDSQELIGRVAELERQASLVLVLAPPPRRAPATLLLADRADAWLVLAALGGTSGEEAKELAEDLEGVAVRPLGLVLADQHQDGET